MFISNLCYNCGARRMEIFYKLKNVPVHSVLILPTQQEALNYPKGDIALGFCHNCGFIANVAYDPALREYSSRYEGTQAFSNTFSSFHQDLAMYLIEKYDLHGKDIIEIGCGQGEFLTLLCKLGENRGVGFDPAFIGRRKKSCENDRITFIKDFYSEKHANYRGEFICCKMTLEHIQRTSDFISIIRRLIVDRLETIVFFQVPNVRRILHELAFWDIYYEHCSYFSLGSLARLFRNCGFDVIDLWKDYDAQYLMIEARPNTGKEHYILPQEDDLEELAQDITYFTDNYSNKLDKWRQNLYEIKRSGKQAVIWGAGSKGVAFLTTLKVQEEIQYAVDINPYKKETYMTGTGQQIVAPDFLREYKPDIIIVMNPIYCNEIRQELDRMKITADLMPVR